MSGVRHVAFGKGENVRSWKHITDDLVALAAERDRESAHVDADSLLVEALRSHAAPSDSKQVEALIEAYENIEKWYA